MVINIGIIYCIPIICGSIAVYTDRKEKKIRNKVTYPLILSGIIFQTVLNGQSGFKSSMMGILICFILLSVLPGTKFSGGDIKLSMGYGAYLGTNSAYYVLITLSLIIIFNILGIVRNYGTADLYKRLELEIISFGKVTAQADKIVAAPILLISYTLALIIMLWG